MTTNGSDPLDDFISELADRLQGLRGDDLAAYEDLEFYSRYVIGYGDPSFKENSKFIKSIYAALQYAIPGRMIGDDEEYLGSEGLGNKPDDNTNFLLLGPRDSAKSTAVDIIYATWMIGLNPLVRILLSVASVETQGLAFSRQINHILTYNERYRKIFGDLVPPRNTQKWTDYEKIVNRPEPPGGLKDPTFAVVGLGSNAPSKRADIIIVDDLVTQQNAYSPTMRGHVERFVFQTLFPIGVPGSVKIILGSRWDPRDLYSIVAERWGLQIPETQVIDLSKISV